MPVSKITLNDGTTSVDVDGHATLGLQQRVEYIGGSGVIQFVDGGSEKHTNWSKRRITITARGWQPPQLDSIDYSQPIALTVHDWASGSETLTVFTDGPVVNDKIHPNPGECTWTLVATEVS